MAGWTGKAASVLLVFIATWGSAIMYWRSTGATPSGMDMLLYLGLLPAGVSSAGFMATGLLRQGADKALEKATRSPDNDAAPVVREDGVKVAAAAALTAGQINLGVGLDAPALLAAAAAPPRPALSARFRDGQNLPVRVSEAAQLDELEVLGEREQGIDTTPRERRALALLAPVLDELLGEAAMALPVLEAREEVVVAGLRRNDEGRVDNVLTVELLVAHGWSDALLHWVRDWLMQRVLEFGVDGRRFDVAVTVVGDDNQAWRHLHRLADALSRAPDRWHLLLACDSCIDPDVIQGWLVNGVLATARHPEGRTPGEGAAGVLLAGPGMATEGKGCLWPPLALEADATQVARPAERRRHLTTAASQWKQSLPQDEHSVQFVLHDARQGSDGVVDAALAASALNPDLEFGTGNLSLPASAGELGPVLPVAMLALALEQTRRNTGPVLLLAGTEAQQRVMALVSAGSTPQAADLPSTT
jgi:hypothetical protein